ncbi:MAG: biotin/lipoyl-containing protein [Vicinamibacterales bacterium]
MRYDIEVNGRVRQVTVVPEQGQFVVTLDEHRWVVDAAQVAGHTLSLLIGNGDAAMVSHEIPVAVDPVSKQHLFGIGPVPVQVSLNTRRRYGRKDEGGADGSGPQRIVAPMPGKVVRVVGKVGDAVSHRQPVVVIEAMKMENELRASRDGTITEVLVQEGQSVEAGVLLAIITPS